VTVRAGGTRARAKPPAIVNSSYPPFDNPDIRRALACRERPAIGGVFRLRSDCRASRSSAKMVQRRFDAEACQYSSRTANQVRPRRQPQDGPGARYHHSGHSDRPRGRGDRIGSHVCSWPISEVAARLVEVRLVGWSGLDLQSAGRPARSRECESLTMKE
jgi:hypothetical protein